MPMAPNTGKKNKDIIETDFTTRGTGAVVAMFSVTTESPLSD